MEFGLLAQCSVVGSISAVVRHIFRLVWVQKNAKKHHKHQFRRDIAMILCIVNLYVFVLIGVHFLFARRSSWEAIWIKFILSWILLNTI